MNQRKGIGLVTGLVTQVLPAAGKTLEHWKMQAAMAEDTELRDQALASIALKKFHVQGGSVYALYPGADTGKAVRFITALQTISDYLDNLCDRAGVYDQEAFSRLHVAMLDAADLTRQPSDGYYSNYPLSKDGEYLSKLVWECRKQLEGLPSYPVVLPFIRKYIRLYSELQTYKHTYPDKRQSLLETWAGNYLQDYPGLTWWEFSAAAGSTLGVFLMYALAYKPDLTSDEANIADEVYFPWICGLHILLDYFIDYQEDLMMGDLNFTSYYDNLHECQKRLELFIEKSLEEGRKLNYPEFHQTVVRGLLSLYLSDPKAGMGLQKLTAEKLLQKGGNSAGGYYRICRFLRSLGVI